MRILGPHNYMVKGLQSCVRSNPEKDSQSLFHCGSFDHPGLPSHNDYKNLIFIFQLQYYMFWGMWYTARKVLKIHFQQYTTRPKTSKFAVAKWRISFFVVVMCMQTKVVKRTAMEKRLRFFLPCFLLAATSLMSQEPWPCNVARTLDSRSKAIPWVLGKPFYVVKGPQA